ncbi:hypothetical protein H4S07_000019 [Coemansia furcata]|uniref:Uncharacterized protein n=1 Tax=Coemansia furcata TaxID=417177 RepID=A0ACC1LSH9_9FUNG|nr:hypothetical protein H4S07_000019 [Coemansia furcata]
MAGVPLAAYTPRLGRVTMQSAEITPMSLTKWAIEEEQGDLAEQKRNRMAKARWARLPKIPLEPKHLSLLWLMAHAAIPTAAKLSHYIPDLPPECKYCYTLSETDAADSGAISEPQRVARENIVHYFWLCPRVQDFWQRVSCFLQGIRQTTAGPVFKVDLHMVTTGFGPWSKRIPNTDVMHGLAVWEIFRARAELSLEGKRLNGLAMFLRWKSTVVARILHDFYYAYSLVKAPHIFTKRWLTVSNRWYHFNPGEDELSVDTNAQAASDHPPLGD